MGCDEVISQGNTRRCMPPRKGLKMKKLLLGAAALYLCQPVMGSKYDQETEAPKTLVSRSQASSPLFNQASGHKMASGLPQYTFDPEGRLCQKPLLAGAATYLNEFQADGMPKPTAPVRQPALRATLFKFHIKQNPHNDDVKNAYLRFMRHHEQDPSLFWSALDAYSTVLLGTTRAYFRDDRTALRQGMCRLLRKESGDPLRPLLEPMDATELPLRLAQLGQEMMTYTDIIDGLKPQGIFEKEGDFYKKCVFDAFLFSIMMSVTEACRPALMTEFVTFCQKAGRRIDTPHGICFSARALMSSPYRQTAKEWLITNLGVHGKAAREDKRARNKAAYENNLHTYMMVKSLAIHFSYLTEIYVDENDQQRACDAIEIALALRPTDVNAVVNATEIYILLDRCKEAKDMMTCYQQLNPRLKYVRDDHDAYMERLERYINHKLGEEEGAFELLRSRQKVIVSKAKQKRRLTVRRQRALQERAFSSSSGQTVSNAPVEPDLKDVPASVDAPVLENEDSSSNVSTIPSAPSESSMPAKVDVSDATPTTSGRGKDEDLQGKKNEKVKKRGIADPSRAKKTLVRETPLVKEAEEVGPEYTPLEKVLTGGAYKVAEKFFTALWGEVREEAVRITHAEVETVMEALEAYHKAQDGPDSVAVANYDASGGKGSHVKVTLRNDRMEREMVTLANHAVLKPYQIEAMRRLFLKGGYYPSHALKVLQDKGYLDKDGLYIPTLKEQKKQDLIKQRVSVSNERP